MESYLLDYSEFIESDDLESDACASGGISYPKATDINTYYEYRELYGSWQYYHKCRFCNTDLIEVYRSKHKDIDAIYHSQGNVWIKECPVCGWWQAVDEYQYTQENEGRHYEAYEYVRRGILKRYKVQDVDIPISTLRHYLNSKPDLLRHINPRSLERLVADVFKDFYNCEVFHLGGPSDGGIDLLLVNGNRQIVVQVKRRSKGKPSESVSLIREFLGAMLLQDQFRGIYVTTADSFSSESSRAISIAMNKSIIDYIDLVDFAKLRDICSLVAYQNSKPWSRFKID